MGLLPSKTSVKISEITDPDLFKQRLQEMRRKKELDKQNTEELLEFLCTRPGNETLVAAIPRPYLLEVGCYEEAFFVRLIQAVIDNGDAEEYLGYLLYLGARTFTGKYHINNTHRSFYVYSEMRNHGLLHYLH